MNEQEKDRAAPEATDFTLEDILEEFGSQAAAAETTEPPETADVPDMPEEPEEVEDPQTPPAPEPEPERPHEEPESFDGDDEDDEDDEELPGDEEDVLLERVPLRERLQAVLTWLRQRRRERPAAAREAVEPEPDMDDAARQERWHCARLRRQALRLLLPTLLLLLCALLDGLELLPPLWYSSVWLRCGVPAGLLLVCLLLAGGLWRTAAMQLRRGRVMAPTAALLAALVSLADSVVCLWRGICEVPPFAAVAALLLLLCARGSYRGARARYDSLHLAQLGGEPPYVVSVTSAGACKQQGCLAGFWRLWQTEDPSVRWQLVLTPLLLVACTVLALVVALAGQQSQRFLWLWSALLSAGLPLSLPLSGALPLSLLSRRLYKSGSAVAGWQGAQAITAARRVVVTDEDLFPAGAVSLRGRKESRQEHAAMGAVELNGLKVYGLEIDRVLAYTEALCSAAGSQLTPLLQQLMDGQVGYRCQVRDLQFYEDGGIAGNIRGQKVALGSAYFMRKRRIALPEGLKMNTGLFLVVDGQLAAVFVVRYLPSRNVDWALRALRRNRITLVLATRDVNLTPGLLRRSFRIKLRPIYPGVATRLALSDAVRERGETPNALIYRDGLLPLAEAVIGSRRMCRALRLSTALCWLGSLCGLLLAYYLTSAGVLSVLSPLYVLAYLLLWLLPTLLLAGLVKYY